MKLRWRFLLLFLVAAFVPFTALFVVVQTSLIDQVREDHRRQLDTRVASAQRRLAERDANDRQAVHALCDHNLVVDRLVLQLATDRFDPQSEQEMVMLMPPMMRGQRFDALYLLDAQGGPSRGQILGAGHYPNAVGGRVPELVDALTRAGEATFAYEARVRDDDTARDVMSLLQGCVVRRDGAAVAVVAGHFLADDFVEELVGDVTPVEFRLFQGPGGPDGGGPDRGTEVAHFEGPEGTALRLVATIDDEPLRREVAALQQRTLYVAGVALLVALFAAVLMTLTLSRPLRSLEAAAQRVASGDLESEIPVTARGEVGRTMRAFNNMTRELAATRKKLLRAERIAAWREVARRIAHEIKNPLQPIQMEIETMRKLHQRKHPDFDVEFQGSTQVILDEVKRLNTMVTEFSRFARLPRPTPVALDLREIVDHVVSLHGSGGAELAVDVDSVVVRADREQLTQVLVNLVQNAADAAEARHGSHGGSVQIRLEPTDDGARLEVADNGTGIDEANRMRIFEPYFTTKSKGTGLGLAIVHRIIGDHGGSIDVEDGIDGGAAFVIQLPVQGPAMEIEASLAETDLPLGRPQP
ncbi:MAG: ATP-binding protein [Myxococcota bacterium]